MTAGRKPSLVKGRPDLVDCIHSKHPVNEGLTPSRVTLASPRLVAWTQHCPACNLQQEWLSTIAEQVQQECICPICASKQLSKSSQSLTEQHPEPALQRDSVMDGAFKSQGVLSDSLQHETGASSQQHALGQEVLGGSARAEESEGVAAAEHHVKLSKVVRELSEEWKRSPGRPWIVWNRTSAFC